MNNILFIAWHDIRYQLRQGATLAWVFVMPPIFFYFIGTVTGGFAAGVTGGGENPLVIEAGTPGFLEAQIDLRLRDNGFEPRWINARETEAPGEDGKPIRTLSFPDFLSDRIIAGEQVTAQFETNTNALAREYEEIQIQRSLYTVVADIVAASARAENSLSPETLQALNETPRIWQLEVESAGKLRKIPSGFEQAIPGILVMFTLLVLLTSGASMLAIERNQGLLRRLASAPISRAEIVTGKWLGRMALAALQITAALVIGTWLFKMNWGANTGFVVLVLGAWAAFCASAGLLLGSVAKTESQAAGLGVLIANIMAALGGCWWPIEVTPQWMQFIQKLLPTGWTMDALHQLISFGAGGGAVIAHILALLAGTMLVTVIAVNRFRYE
jgi:ABC-type multidrug transport system permease subunit